MAKRINRKAKKKKTSPLGNIHLFIGGNYGMGCKALKGAGLFQMVRLKEVQEVGTKIPKSNKTDERDTFVFLDTRTVDIMIDHLTYLKENM